MDADVGAILPLRESTRYRLPKDPADILTIIPEQPEVAAIPTLPALEPTLESFQAVWDSPEPEIQIVSVDVSDLFGGAK